MILLALLALPAEAADLHRQVVPWQDLAVQAAAPDADARGPELLAAGPAGLLAVCDPVAREVALLDEQSLSGGRVLLSFPVRLCSDLAFAPDGELLVLDHSARRLALVSQDGVPLAEADLPALAPTALRLAVEDDQVAGVDLFGNHHPLATVVGGGLQPPRQDALDERAGAVSWDAASRTMRTDTLAVALPQALVASGQLVGDWLLVDQVVGDSPALVVRREAWHLPTATSVALPVNGRLYAPRGDATQDSAGRLLVLDPRDDGLGLLVVTP